MPPKSVKKILNQVLGDLDEKHFKKFKNALIDRKEEPRIPLSVIEKADEMDIVDAIVRTYTEKKAISVAIDILDDIDCNELKVKLEDYMKGTAEEQGPPVVKHAMGGKHFVDSHRAALIQRVTSVNAILDDLLEKGVLNGEKYSEVNAEKMRQEKMRKLYDVISAGGSKGKDVFYTSLQKHETFLMNDLKG